MIAPVIQAEASRGQEDRQSHDVVRLAEPSGGDAAQESPFQGRDRHASVSRQARIDDLSGGDAVHTDAAMAPFCAQFAGHLNHRPHRHAVGDVAATQRRRTGERADVHDRAAPLREHSPPGLLAHGESADDQVLQDAMQVGDGEFFGLRQMPVTRDVAQEIDSAELGVDLPEQFVDGGRVGDIGAATQRLRPRALHRVRRRLGAGQIAID